MQPFNKAGLAGSVHKTFLNFGPLSLGLSLGLLFSGLAVAQTFTEFEAPGSGTAAFQGTVAISINTSGVIAGEYYDSTGVSHGFVRTAAGDITSFEASGAQHEVPWLEAVPAPETVKVGMAPAAVRTKPW